MTQDKDPIQKVIEVLKRVSGHTSRTEKILKLECEEALSALRGMKAVDVEILAIEISDTGIAGYYTVRDVLTHLTANGYVIMKTGV